MVVDTLPSEYDRRVKAMEVDTRPTEQYSDIGGVDKQIQVIIQIKIFEPLLRIYYFVLEIAFLFKS